MAFAILRHQKLKGAAIAAADSHNTRSSPVPHSNGGPTRRLVGRTDHCLERQIDARIAMVGAKVRSNSVKAMELVLSASPEHFRPCDPGAAGRYDKAPTREWLDASIAWLKSRYGENLIAVDLHLDESTPHLHAVIVPLTPDNRLSAKETHGIPQLQKNQSSYAEALAGLGLQRGIPSKRKHSRVQEFYKKAMRALGLGKKAKELVEQAELRANRAERRADDAESQIPVEVERRLADAVKAAVEPYKAAYAKQNQLRQRENQNQVER